METEERQRRRPGSFWVWGVLLVIVGLIVLFAALKMFRARQDTGAVAEEKPVAVETMLVAATRLADTIVLPGRVEPYVEADLAAEKAGRIVEVKVDKGDRVEQGQVLLRIDDRLWVANRDRAAIDLREAEKEHRRWEELKKTGAVSDSDYDSIRKARDIAAVSLADADVHVSQCTVVSPVNGVVDDRYVEQGEYVAEGAPVFKVVHTDRVKVSVQVPEKTVLAVGAGDRMRFRVAAAGDRIFEGQVSFVSTAGSRLSNSFRTELVVGNADHVLKPGMIAEVSLVRGTIEDAVRVPLSTVIPSKGEHVAFVVESGRAVRRLVKIDRITGDEAVIASGVRPGDSLVASGQRTLQDGTLVDVRNGTGSKE